MGDITLQLTFAKKGFLRLTQFLHGKLSNLVVQVAVMMIIRMLLRKKKEEVKPTFRNDRKRAKGFLKYCKITCSHM